MSFHNWFGQHIAEARYSHWDGGHFVSRCAVCHCEMVKLPGLSWRVTGRPT